MKKNLESAYFVKNGFDLLYKYISIIKRTVKFRKKSISEKSKKPELA